MATIRIALIGCGNICRNHLKALKDLNDPSLLITVLVDPNIKSAESIRESLLDNSKDICKIYSSLDQVDTSSYDAAVLMTPHDIHLHLANDVILHHNKHLLLEKPAATTIQECKELEQLAAKTDKVFMVAESAVFWPEVVRALELVKEGVIGEPFYVKSNYWEAIGEKDYSLGLVPSWVFEPERVGGGVLMAGGIHWIRLLRLFFGDISKVVSVESKCWDLSKGESLSQSLIEFENGKNGSLYCHYNGIPMEKIPFCEIFGPKGEIAIHGDLFEGGLTIHTKDGLSYHSTVENHGGYFGAFGPQMAHFISSVKRGQPITSDDTSSVWEGTKDVYVAKAMYKSVETGSWVNVTEI